jgi:hypothetical protein
VPYDAIQRRIVYNHLAIGVNGRQGPNIALRVDHKPEAPVKEKPVKKIIIDGVTYEGNEQLAEVVEQLQRKQGAALAEAQSKADAKDKRSPRCRPRSAMPRLVLTPRPPPRRPRRRRLSCSTRR